MKTCGITAEYNPFHNGHKYQIEEARRRSGCDAVIVVMSGNFVQRGEPAIIDKWKRAEAAIRGGADLVIELPYIYATQSASAFAHGAVSLLKLAGVSSICFGSECGNLENLQDIADTPVNPDHLHMSMDQGMSFPKAYSLLTSEMKPNDILAVSYLKELKGTDIEPIAIQRTSNYLSTEMHPSASALAIRTAMHDGGEYADSTPMTDILKESVPVYLEQYYPYIRTYLLTSDPVRLAQTFLFTEGIENHLIRCAKANSTFKGFMRDAVTYRYTAGRIRRCLLQAIVQTTKEEVRKLPALDTLRVLAFNETGRQWLHDMRKSDVRIASRFADVPYPWRVMEYRSSLMYTSVMEEAERERLLNLEIRGAHFVK